MFQARERECSISYIIYSWYKYINNSTCSSMQIRFSHFWPIKIALYNSNSKERGSSFHSLSHAYLSQLYNKCTTQYHPMKLTAFNFIKPVYSTLALAKLMSSLSTYKTNDISILNHVIFLKLITMSLSLLYINTYGLLTTCRLT